MLARDERNVLGRTGFARELELLDERLGHRALGARAHLHQDAADLASLLLLQVQGGAKTFGLDVSVAEQQLPELVPPSLAPLIKGRHRRGGGWVGGPGFDRDVATDLSRLRAV